MKIKTIEGIFACRNVVDGKLCKNELFSEDMPFAWKCKKCGRVYNNSYLHAIKIKYITIYDNFKRMPVTFWNGANEIFIDFLEFISGLVGMFLFLCSPFIYILMLPFVPFLAIYIKYKALKELKIERLEE